METFGNSGLGVAVCRSYYRDADINNKARIDLEGPALNLGVSWNF